VLQRLRKRFDYFFPRPGRCVRAEAAADFAALLALGLLSVRAAADAAFALVTSPLRLCVNAEPAADFAALLALELCKVLPAAEAAFLPVLSPPLFLTIGAAPQLVDLTRENS
jgi:hypothetical protein